MKKKLKQPQQKKAQVHIMLDNPVEVRRGILTSALDTAKLLKEVEELRAIKEKKIKTIRKLSRVVKEIKIIEKQFSEMHMPHYNEATAELLPRPRVHHEKHPEEKAEQPKKAPVNQQKPEAERLKNELDEIEKKLKSL